MKPATLSVRHYWTSYTDKPSGIYAARVTAKQSSKLIAKTESEIESVAVATVIDLAASHGYTT